MPNKKPFVIGAKIPPNPLNVTAYCYSPNAVLAVTRTAGSAYVQPLQFNINIPATAGTVYVKKDNAAAVGIIIDTGFTITEVGYRVFGTTPWKTLDVKKVSLVPKAAEINIRAEILKPHHVEFVVTATPKSGGGIMTLEFMVSYTAKKESKTVKA